MALIGVGGALGGAAVARHIVRPLLAVLCACTHYSQLPPALRGNAATRGSPGGGGGGAAAATLGSQSRALIAVMLNAVTALEGLAAVVPPARLPDLLLRGAPDSGEISTALLKLCCSDMVAYLRV